MDFRLTPQQKMILKVVRDFAEKEIIPIAQEYDEEEKFPLDVYKKMGKLDLLGLTVPKEYGGAGCDTLTYCMVVEEVSKACCAIGGMVAGANSLVNVPILNNGTEEQKQKYLVPLARGDLLGAFALTEPEAGSDAINQQTTAIDAGDHYVLNGVKCFISGGDVAEVVIVIGKICRPGRIRGKLTAFLVEKSFPGFSVGTKEKKLGIRASGTCELVFQDTPVPKENVLGRVGKGFKMAMDTLDGGRISIAAQAVGVGAACLEESLKYSKERRQFNQPICKFQGIQWKLAEMATQVDAARLLTHRAAVLKDAGQPFGMEAAMAKLYASDVAVRASREAVQIHGGYGYMKDYVVERLYRDAKITEIYEGTSEVQRLVIANALLKK